MPLYEYICEADGEVLELLRPISQADDPVPDPRGLSRRFIRRQSTFAAKNGASAGASSGASALPMGGCCPCGKPGGGGGCRSM